MAEKIRYKIRKVLMNDTITYIILVINKKTSLFAKAKLFVYYSILSNYYSTCELLNQPHEPSSLKSAIVL